MDIGEYIQSGIIESYVLGITTSEEITEVEEMAGAYKQILDAINEFSFNLERFGTANAVSPNPAIKPMIMATIKLTRRCCR